MPSRKCISCGIKKSLLLFRDNRKKCIKCNNKRARKYNEELKLLIFNKYGGARCQCCGETHLDFLTIDHINGNGKKHRESLGGGGHSVYRWLKKNNYPPGFRVLCFNCNFGMHVNKGICPHKT